MSSPTDIEQAKQLIQQERADRLAECAEGIAAVLEKYGSDLEVSPAQLSLVAKT